MAKNQNKTVPSQGDVAVFLDGHGDQKRAGEARAVAQMMQEITGEAPVLWGSIIGFGQYHYKYDSGREGDFFRTGVAPRKQALTLHILAGFSAYEDLLADLGPHTTGKSCLYIKHLDKVDEGVLREIIARSYAWMAETYPA